MKFTDLIVEYPEALDPDICDTIIERFNNDDRVTQGQTAVGIRSDVKTSIDLHLSICSNWNDIDQKLFDSLSPFVKKYNEVFEYISHCGLHGISDSGYQIQKTVDNGFYSWHHDYTSTIKDNQKIIPPNINQEAASRYATYIYYLNDVSDDQGGTTQFRFGDDIIEVKPEKGKLLFFPANQLYNHCGSTLHYGEKYIVTGWLSTPVWYRLDK